MKTHIELTHSPIIYPPFKIVSDGVGAQVEFLGIVRELEDGRSIAGLRYEAFEPMALSTLETILAELHLVHPCLDIWLIHRLGFIPVGEVAMFIRVHASHRKSALNMMDALIDRLKMDVPIWKLK
jgi:molybdopterin synthase catalytic subunit